MHAKPYAFFWKTGNTKKKVCCYVCRTTLLGPSITMFALIDMTTRVVLATTQAVGVNANTLW